MASYLNTYKKNSTIFNLYCECLVTSWTVHPGFGAWLGSMAHTFLSGSADGMKCPSVHIQNLHASRAPANKEREKQLNK